MKILRVFLPPALLCLLTIDPGRAATPYAMSSGNYSESFTNLAIWTDNFTSPSEATRWSSVAVNPVGVIPDGQRVMRAATNFTTLSTGGVQKDFSAGARLAFLSTGAVDNTNSTAIDLHLDFTGRLPGTLSYDWVALTNSTGDRAASLRIYTSTNGSLFTELPAAAVLNKSNNVPASGSVVAVALPATLANSPTARLRFYQYNGTGGSVGSRAKIAIDNIVVTSTTTDLVVTNDADSGPGTLRQTIADISPGRTITFASSLSGANLVLTGGELVLNKTLTIDASALPGGITLDGATNSRILRTTAGTTNLLRNLTLRGGNGVGAVATGSGGAIYNQGRLTLTGCTVAENAASSGGGGIFTEGAASQLLMTNCTVAANTAGFAGAFLIRNSSSVALVHCTISANTGTGGSGGVVLESSAVLSLQNSIIAGNGDDLGGCGGTLTRSGNNIIGSQPLCYTSVAPVGSPNANGDYVGASVTPVDPVLASLANYGGPTRTMPPLPGSPAIDTAVVASTTTDQRGYFRPNGGGPDIGAAEYYLVANDAFNNRLSLIGKANTVTGSNIDATKQATEPDHASNGGGHSLWWTWTAPAAGVVSFDTTGSTFDTLLAVYTGSQISNLFEVASNDQLGAGSDQSRVAFVAASNTTYQIAVDGWNGAVGTVVLNQTLSLAPLLTQSPAGATNIVGNTQNFEVAALSTTSMTYQWWKDNAPLAGATNDVLSLVDLRPADTGNYAVVVANGGGAVTSAVAPLLVPAVPANDQFTNRIFFAGISNSVFGSTVGATVGTAPESFFYSSGDLWWAWIAPTNGRVAINSSGSEIVPMRTIYTYDGTNLTYLTSDPGELVRDTIAFDAVAGRQYVFQIGGYVSGSGSVVLNLQMQWLPPTITGQPQPTYAVVGTSAYLSVGADGNAPLYYQWRRNGVPIAAATDSFIGINSVQFTNAGIYSVVVSNAFGVTISSNAALVVVVAPAGNDGFASRIPLSGSTNVVSGHNINFSKEGGEPNHAGSSGGASAWWSWTAGSNRIAVVDLAGSSFDTLLGIYTGTGLTNLTTIATNDNWAGSSASRVVFPCTSGVTYQIAVDGRDNASGTIALRVESPATLAPQIVAQPAAVGGVTGTTAQFSVLAYGMPTNLTYQWFSNGVALVGGTKATLAVSNLQSAWSGTGYTVVVSNSMGAVTSSVATLTVAAPTTIAFKGNWPGYWGGAANDVQVAGAYAYVATDAGLLVLDVSDPHNPYRVGAYATDTPAIRLSFTNGYVSVITKSNQIAGPRVSRFDVRNVALPKKVAEYQASAPQAIAALGNYIYLGDGTNLLILNPNLQPVRSNALAGDVREMLVRDNQLIVTVSAAPALTLYDISNPTNLVPLSTVELAHWGKVSSLDDTLYVLGFNRAQAFDIGNPASPQPAGEGPLNISPDAISGMVAHNGLLHVFWWNHNWPETRVVVCDIHNPRYVTEVGAYVMPPIEGGFDQRYGLSGSGQYLFVAAGASGLMILDTSNPAKPVIAGQFYSAVQAEDGALENNHAFVTDRNTGFHILDVSNPVNPQRLGTYRIANQQTNTADRIVVEGRYAYVGISALNWAHAFEIIDIAAPANPILLGRLSLPGGDAYYSAQRVTGLAAEGGLAVMAVRGGHVRRLFLIDVRDKARPRLLQTISDGPFGFGITGLTITSNHVYAVEHVPIGDYQPTLKVYEINSVTNLAKVWEEPLPLADGFPASGPTLALNQRYAYVGASVGTMIFDAVQPDQPLRITSAPFPGFLSRAESTRGFGSTVETGFNHFDLTNPGLPVLTGNFPGIYGDIEAEGRYAFVAGGEAGLTILDLGAAAATAPLVRTQPESIRAIPGATTNLFVGASGTVPLTFQWRLHGTNLPGRTSALLVLPDVQSDDAGNYSVLVTNASGAALSSVAVLSVDQPAEISLLSPGPNEYVWPGSNVLVSASAFDPDATNGWKGYVRRVDFYTNAAYWQTVTNPAPFTNVTFDTVLSNAAAGLLTLQARALDNEGAWSTSAVVSVTVTTLPALQLSASAYSVYESNGLVTVGIRRNIATNTAEVFLTTENATAFAAPPGGVGSYLALVTNLTLPPGVLSTNIEISIINDLVNRGDRQFVVRLTNASSGWSLVEPTNAYVTIFDDDPLTNNFADVVLPPAVATGALQVSLLPTNAVGKWRFWWETDWRNSGSSASNLTAGSYALEFLPRSGYIAPAPTTVSLSNGLVFLSITNYYTNLVGTLATGSLKVTISPSQVASASEVTNRGQWRIASLGTNWLDGDVALTNLAAGAHLVEFKPVPGYQIPPAQVAVVAPSNEVIYAGNYQPVITPAANGPVPLDSYTTITNDAIQPGTPYRFSGQIFSDAGFSSGFVVKKRTVLTAAHAVFDFGRLTFATNVWWFFQRQRGEHEPLAQQPRGWQVFAGYATARTNDPSPNVSTIETRSLDVAALYFLEDAGRGGYGGYLITTTNGQWLDGAQLKLMVGYPVEGVAETNQGRMHQVGPFFAAFQRVTNQVYRTDQVFSYGGNSGGPVCVLSTNSSGRAFFIPAGIYLGGSGETVARAIDLDVVDLINRAENSSAGGTNSTGGGVIPVSRSLGATLAHPAYLQVSVGPPAALRLGAMWRISPTNFGELGELRFYTNYTPNPQTLAIRSTNFSIETIGLAGFQPPSEHPLVLSENSVQELRLLYSVNPPWLTYHSTQGLGMTGTVATAYQIEVSSLLGSNWSLLPSNITLSAGTNWIPATGLSSSNRFFRARWLPD